MSQTTAQLISGTSAQSPTFGATTVTSLNGGPIAGTRNRIINGDMRIDQRNAGASVTITSTGGGQFTLDRWFGQASQSSKYSVQRNAGPVTPPTGFTNYLGVTSLSAYAVTAGDYFSINQAIEGFNGADLAFGTANATTVTISFKVYSSLTGTFGGVLQNGAFNRSYPFTYTISSANTWTTVSVVIPGDTSGTWATDNSKGLVVIFGLGVGSTYSGTAGAWGAANYISATGATSVVGTSGATFYITGVQLEPGTVATPFERRSYGAELALCQRYFWKETYYGNGFGDITNTVACAVNLPATMRAQPSVTNSADSSGIVANGILYNLTAASATIINGWYSGHNMVIVVTTNAQITRWTTAYIRILNLQANSEL